MSLFFKEISPLQMEELMMDEDRCLEYIAEEKWKDG